MSPPCLSLPSPRPFDRAPGMEGSAPLPGDRTLAGERPVRPGKKARQPGDPARLEGHAECPAVEKSQGLGGLSPGAGRREGCALATQKGEWGWSGEPFPRVHAATLC